MVTKALPGALVAVCVVVGVVGLARGEMVVLAQTGEGAPDGNGTYLEFRNPVLNAFGRIAFAGDLAGTAGGYDDDRGIFRVDAGGGTVICREGWVTPAGDGWFNKLYDPAMNNASQLAFRGEAADTPLWPYDGIGVYRGSPGVLDQLFRGNDLAPDGNGRFMVMDYEILFDDDVATVFRAGFTDTAGGYSDDTGIVVNGWGISKIAVREGQWVPSGNGRFAGFLQIAANMDQNVAFLGTLRNTTAGSDNNVGIFSARPWSSGVNLVELVREGDAPPDGNGEYRSFSLSPTLDNMGNGRIGFHAWLRNTSGGTDDDSGIFLAMDAGVARIARETQSPPDGNGQYSNFDSDIAQNDSYVAFRAWLRNTSGAPLDDQGLYRGNGLTTRKIVRTGEPSPDGNGVFRSVWDIVMNKPGHLAFHGQLEGTAGGSTDERGIFIGDGFDTVQVARTGDPLLGSTIVELHLAEGPDCRNGMNQHSQVAYRAVLADGREALVLFTPELQWKGGSGAWAVAVNWTLSIVPKEIYGVAIAPDGSADVAGPRTYATVKSLTIGSTGGGTATLNLTGLGDLTALEEVAIGPNGHILVGAGRALTAAALLNQGTLAFESGQGHVLGDVTNLPEGRILVPAGANAWIHGLLEHTGVVEVAPGGEVHLLGLTGNGCTGAGTTWLEGDVRPGLGVGQMGFEGDVILGRGGVMHIELGGLAPGTGHDKLNVIGAATLDGTLAISLINRFLPAPGDEFEIMTYGSRTGEFADTTGWLFGRNKALVKVYGANALALFATYQGDATLDLCVDGLDYVAWSSNYLTGDTWQEGDYTGDGYVDGLDYIVWSTNYLQGCPASPGAVPEPASGLVLALGALVLLRRRCCGAAATATGA